MPFLPTTDTDRLEMLETIGVKSVADLFHDVPEDKRFPDLNLPKAASEMEVLAELNALARKNQSTNNVASFLGAGAYNHFVPSAIPHLATRGEFITAYTPYQPEVSQGTLQAIFEYQSMMAELTGMDVVNASHYDGATSMAEAAIMSLNATRGKRSKIIVSPTIDPQYRRTLRTYLPGDDVNITGDENLQATLADLKGMLDKSTACLIVQNPDFFGALLDVDGLADAVHAVGALLVVVANPIMSLGLITPPAEYGADIVVAEGQPLGSGLNFGGPYLGVFAANKKLMRKMPGRLVGETTDTEGRRGFVLTLTPREQHIRREKATSNICTNQGLVALMAGMYMAYMGKQGIREVAEQCYHKAHYAAAAIAKLDGYELAQDGPFFNEFVVKCPKPVAEINAALLQNEIIGGYDLQKDYPHAENEMLLCVTEMNSREQIDQLVAALASA
ncbi:MAG: aminomethyl-transferring glycine dehydrogenase subunit GcvPA [Chloroflexi bacterium]|nr:MAG: aminomethyl-transferring glycine dehydrogenase subunit GcvPA [Chloroflexota bacterium]